jgi:hypothetical protein
VSSLKAVGHEFFGQWFPKYDPKLHDSIMGPVEEFVRPLGYDDAPVGGKFIRVGVGVLRKPEEPNFQRFRTYDIVDPGTWTNKVHKDRVEFVHELSDGAGTSYRYTKVLRLVGNKPEMRIEHTLRNTGTKPIATAQYNHNFFVIDGKPTGPGVVVRFPFALKAARPLQEGIAEVRGRELVYLKEIPEGKSAFTELEGFGPTAADFNVEMEHGPAGAGVRMVGDRPIKRIVYWSIRSTFCTEPYIDIAAEPGKETRWVYTYTFYKLP